MSKGLDFFILIPIEYPVPNKLHFFFLAGVR